MPNKDFIAPPIADNLIRKSAVKPILESIGLQITAVNPIPEGRSHLNFKIALTDGSLMVARFKKPGGGKNDTYFNGPLSLEREKKVIDLVRGQAGLPAPHVYGLYDSPIGSFLLVKHMSGVYWSEYLKNNNYSRSAYFRSLRFLGRDMAHVHRVGFGSFGDVMGKDEVYPGTVSTFADRVQMVTELKIQKVLKSDISKEVELNTVVSYLQNKLTRLADIIASSPQKPVLTLTDLHPMNFFVDNKGKPSGYFDLEFCQAAVPALEFYFIRYHLLNYFCDTAQQAEASFMVGYEEAGGKYDPRDPANMMIEQILTIGHLLDAVRAYHNVSDGLRDTWSDQFKRILFDAIQGKGIDYQAITDVTRNKTGQPKYAQE